MPNLNSSNREEGLISSILGRPSLSEEFIRQDSERRAGGGNVLEDRALEGEMYGRQLPGGFGIGLAAALGGGYEGLVKPIAQASPTINSVLPEAFQYREGVSSPSWAHGGLSETADRLKALLGGAIRGTFDPTRRLY